jgi:hypothetical protein
MFLDEKKIGETQTDTFLPAVALGIGERERDALIESLYLMESGAIKDGGNTKDWSLPDYSTSPPIPTLFHMAMTARETECGTACCILGIARAVSKNWNILNNSIEKRHPANPLFFPLVPGALSCSNPARGAKALRSYLETGDPKWAEAMA